MLQYNYCIIVILFLSLSNKLYRIERYPAGWLLLSTGAENPGQDTRRTKPVNCEKSELLTFELLISFFYKVLD